MTNCCKDPEIGRESCSDPAAGDGTGRSVWHIIAPEFPPQVGGVADYTHLVAAALTSVGNTVHVWAPGANRPRADGVLFHALTGGMSRRSLQMMSRWFDGFSCQNHILVQWVPHGYGYRSMNVPFCRWVLQRAQRGDRIELMVHEPFLRFRQGSWRQDLAATVHRLMVSLLLRASTNVWVSTPDWEPELRPWAFGRELGFKWLPVPNNIPVVQAEDEVRLLRDHLRASKPLLAGHFGTFAPRVRDTLLQVLPRVIRRGDTRVVLLGPGSHEFRGALIQAAKLDPADVTASGALPHRELSLHLSSCDLMIQPYPDGLNGRRGSAMAGIAHGKAVVATRGRATEPIWSESRGVMLAEAHPPEALESAVHRLLDQPEERAQIAERGRMLYSSTFDVRHTVNALVAAQRASGL